MYASFEVLSPARVALMVRHDRPKAVSRVDGTNQFKNRNAHRSKARTKKNLKVNNNQKQKRAKNRRPTTRHACVRASPAKTTAMNLQTLVSSARILPGYIDRTTIHLDVFLNYFFEELEMVELIRTVVEGRVGSMKRTPSERLQRARTSCRFPFVFFRWNATTTGFKILLAAAAACFSRVRVASSECDHVGSVFDTRASVSRRGIFGDWKSRIRRFDAVPTRACLE